MSDNHFVYKTTDGSITISSMEEVNKLSIPQLLLVHNDLAGEGNSRKSFPNKGAALEAVQNLLVQKFAQQNLPGMEAPAPAPAADATPAPAPAPAPAPTADATAAPAPTADATAAPAPKKRGRRRLTDEEKAAREKAKAEKKANAAPRAPRGPLYEDSWIIRIMQKENPKRQHTKAHRKYAACQDGMTVGEYRKLIDEKEGKGEANAELRYCVGERGFWRLMKVVKNEQTGQMEEVLAVEPPVFPMVVAQSEPQNVTETVQDPTVPAEQPVATTTTPVQA